MPRWQLGGLGDVGVSGGPRSTLGGGLRSGPQMPTGLHMASDATTLCPKLRVSVGPLPVPVPESLAS